MVYKPTLDNIIGHHARKAAQIMEERGWTRGMEERSATGEVCLTGAFRRAVKPMGAVGGDLVDRFNRRFGAWMQLHYPAPPAQTLAHCPLAATSWNDNVFQSKEETLAWLDKFADDLDPQR